MIKDQGEKKVKRIIRNRNNSNETDVIKCQWKLRTNRKTVKNLMVINLKT